MPRQEPPRARSPPHASTSSADKDGAAIGPGRRWQRPARARRRTQRRPACRPGATPIRTRPARRWQSARSPRRGRPERRRRAGSAAQRRWSPNRGRRRRAPRDSAAGSRAIGPGPRVGSRPTRADPRRCSAPSREPRKPAPSPSHVPPGQASDVDVDAGRHDTRATAKTRRNGYQVVPSAGPGRPAQQRDELARNWCRSRRSARAPDAGPSRRSSPAPGPRRSAGAGRSSPRRRPGAGGGEQRGVLRRRGDGSSGECARTQRGAASSARTAVCEGVSKLPGTCIATRRRTAARPASAAAAPGVRAPSAAPRC